MFPRPDQGEIAMRTMKKGNDPRVEMLLEQIRGDDPRAFAKLVRELEPFVLGSSLKVCRDRSIAEENMQDTFVSMYRKLGQFDGTSKFSTWLYAIIVNNCRMKRRRRKLDMASMPIDGGGEEGEGMELRSEEENPEAQLLGGELRAVLGSAIEALPEEYRAVFILRDVEHLSTTEVAESLGLSEAAVKSRLHRGRERVRRHVERYMEEESANDRRR